MQFCPTYPSQIAAPSKISDSTLKYAVKYRSKGRIPGLVYLHWANLGSITRSSQPMVGIKGARSIQDEKLIETIFTSHSHHSTAPPAAPRTSFMRSTSTTVESITPAVFGAQSANLIIDARPTTNARANSVMGAGSENMDHYKNCEKAYLGIDNIHVMRSSLNAVFDAMREAEETQSSVDVQQLKRSNWLKHLTTILDGTVLIVKTIHLSNSHVLIHCSDGWDRTSQLSSLSQLCLDPFYRTAKGLVVLIEKDWSSYGHKFAERSGLYCGDRVSFLDRPREDQSAQSAFLASVRGQFSGNSHAYKETCPVFQQWCDCIYQVMRQFPDRFEYNEAWLRAIVRSVLLGKGGFACDNERERRSFGLDDESAWVELLPGGRLPEQYRNPSYDPGADYDVEDRTRYATDKGVLLPDSADVRWWHAFFNRTDEEMNPPVHARVDGKEEIKFIQTAAEDPVVGITTASFTRPEQRSESPVQQYRSPSPSVNRPSSFGSSSGLTPSSSQAQLQSTISSVQKLGWGAWKQVTKGYQEAVAQYRDYNANPSAVSSQPSAVSSASAGQQSPDRSRSRPRTPTAASVPASGTSRTGIVDDINAYRASSPLSSAHVASDIQQESTTRWTNDMKAALPVAQSKVQQTNGNSTASESSSTGDPLGVGLN